MQGTTELLPLAPGREPSGRGGPRRSPLRRLADDLSRQLRAVGRSLSGLAPLEKAALRLPLCDAAHTWAAASLTQLGVDVHCSREELARIPAEGPVIFYANHPTGALDGLVMAALCGRARPDLKILASSKLLRLPQLAPLASMLLPLDLSGEDRAANGASLRLAVKHLRKGGALGIFPAGRVARWRAGAGLEEQTWTTLLSRLGEWRQREGSEGEAPRVRYIPLHVQASADPLFLSAACLHEGLATALLPRVLWRQRGSRVSLHVGEALREQHLDGLDHEQRTHCLRLYRESLARGRKQNAAVQDPANVKRQAPLAAGADPQDLMVALAALPQSRVLAREGKYSVYVLHGSECPLLLDEVTRRREESFRALGEGTGKARDTDRYDRQYEHLLLVDEEAQCLAGAYRARLVRPDEAAACGRSNLYTASLFRYDPEFFRQCGNALELGRAFVCLEYQREYAPLMLLWKGIAQLALLRGARALFGPASMGLNYRPQSVDLLWRHLRLRHWHAPLAALVQGRKPRALRGELPFARHMDYNCVNTVVRQMENGRGLPILFKHYLQLGGRIAAFHEDRAFGTLDALLVVDLLNAPEKQLRRFLGEDGMAALRDGMWHTCDCSNYGA
ncbi:lysophospholipid acyltransferase family protein [Desulfovibrio intestinalis]|uniref:Putative hemolysin n=1 Tax=Desulfovibrio intestinalis TaxID=58621 RepID=A0A7W8C328_9BACT|nr:lysophospholipid acyltransferase family protein [Desulfovibrio intestinalis]MBB5144436.1 putative hemolysin [Desulfovibrio intestinalis]